MVMSCLAELFRVQSQIGNDVYGIFVSLRKNLKSFLAPNYMVLVQQLAALLYKNNRLAFFRF